MNMFGKERPAYMSHEDPMDINYDPVRTEARGKPIDYSPSTNRKIKFKHNPLLYFVGFVLTEEHGWKAVRHSSGRIYKYQNATDVNRMLRMCYPNSEIKHKILTEEEINGLD